MICAACTSSASSERTDRRETAIGRLALSAPVLRRAPEVLLDLRQQPIGPVSDIVVAIDMGHAVAFRRQAHHQKHLGRRGFVFQHGRDHPTPGLVLLDGEDLVHVRRVGAGRQMLDVVEQAPVHGQAHVVAAKHGQHLVGRHGAERGHDPTEFPELARVIVARPRVELVVLRPTVEDVDANGLAKPLEASVLKPVPTLLVKPGALCHGRDRQEHEKKSEKSHALVGANEAVSQPPEREEAQCCKLAAAGNATQGEKKKGSAWSSTRSAH